MRLEILSKREIKEKIVEIIDHKHSLDVSSPEKEVDGKWDCDPVYKIFVCDRSDG